MDTNETSLPVVRSKPLSGKIIGVGGAGANAIEHICGTDLAQLSLGAIHTNARILQARNIPQKLLLGVNRTHGLGAGGDYEVGKVIAEDEFSSLQNMAAGADLIFIITGLGGGSGSGIAPVLARAAKESGALVLALATLPFEFEGARRHQQAQQGLAELKAACDAVICLPNNKVFKMVDANTSVLDLFQYTNELLAQGVRGIWQMLTRPGLINVDFAYLYSVVRGRHAESSFATAEARGDNRAREVVEKLIANPLLDNGQCLNDADEILVSLVGGPDLTISDVNRVMEQLNRRTENGHLIMGAAIDPQFEGKISLTVVASRNSKSMPQPIEVNRIAGPSTVAGAFFVEENQPQPARPVSRFVAPPPASTPRKTQELLDKKHGSSRIRNAGSHWKQGQLPLEIVSKGRFEKSAPTIHQGEDLDVPTYVRRGVPLN